MTTTDLARIGRSHGWSTTRLPVSRKRPTAILRLVKQVPNAGQTIHRTVTLSVDATTDAFGFQARLFTSGQATGRVLRTEAELAEYLASYPA